MSILETVRRAESDGALVTVLRGEDGTALPTPYGCPATVPTDHTRILREGVYPLSVGARDVALLNSLQEALVEMMWDARGVYCALLTLLAQVQMERSGVSPFKICRERIARALRVNLLRVRPELLRDFRWMGQGEERGLWDESLRLCEVLESIYGLTVLSPEDKT